MTAGQVAYDLGHSHSVLPSQKNGSPSVVTRNRQLSERVGWVATSCATRFATACELHISR